MPIDATSTGAITIPNASPAQISWQPTATEFSTAGSFSIYVVVTLSTDPVVYDPIPFQIQAR